MPKLVAMMIVRNEAHRYLTTSLGSLQEYVHDILVLDDHSTDHTEEICLSYPKVRLIRRNKSIFWNNESLLRQECWKHTIALKPDWILAIDADEIIEESMKKELPSLLNQKEYHNIAFRLIEFWGSTEYYRVDKLWNPRNRWVINLIRYHQNHPYHFSPNKLHCGRLPVNLPGKTLYSKYHLKHYGYANPKEHVEKFLRYMKNDPFGEHCPLSHYLSILDEDPKLKPWKKKEEVEEKKKTLEEVKGRAKEEKADIIIVSYNNMEDLKRCIESIYTYTSFPFQLIVVDNNSTDGTKEYLETREDLTPIFLKSNKGYAIAANKGIKKGDGEYIFILNQDIIVTRGWLEPLIQTFRKNTKAAVVGPKLITPEGKIAGAGVIGTPSHHHIRGFLEPDYPELYGEEESCLSISGACYGIRRSLLPIIGLFDESFFFYFEETDYSLRVKQKGYQVIYSPKSLVYHDMRWEERDHQSLNKLFCQSRSIFEEKWLAKKKRDLPQKVYRKRFGVLDA